MASDGKVTISTELDNSQIKSGLSEVMGSFGGLKKVLGGIKQAMSSAFASGGTAQEKLAVAGEKNVAAIQKQENAIASLKAKHDLLASGTVAPTSLKQIEAELKKTQAEYDKLEKQAVEAQQAMSALDIGLETPELTQAQGEFERIAAEIDKISPKLFDLQDKAEALRLNPASSAEAQKLAGDIEVAQTKVTQLKNKSSLLATPFGKARAAFSSFASAVGTGGKKVFNVLGNIASSAFSKIKDGFKKSRAESSKFGKSATMMFTRLKGVILSAFIFNGVSKALRGLTEYLGSVMATNAEFTQSMQIVRGNLLTAFQPIIDFIMPILSSFARGLAFVTAQFANFTAMLGGKTTAQTSKAAKALNNEAKAIKGVGKEAKTAKGALLSFDEINQLQSDTADGASGGMGADTGASLGFAADVAPIDFVSSLTDMINSSDWSGIGVLFGTKLNEAFSRVQSFISWENLKGSIATGIAGVGGFLNSLIATINFENIGATFGAGLTTISRAATMFFDTIDWAMFGIKLSEGLGGLINNTDWAAFGGMFGGYLQSLLMVAYHFVSNFDWAATGKALSDGIMGWFNKIDWVMLGSTIAKTVDGLVDLIYNFVVNTDWAHIAKKMGDGINAIFNIDWAKLGLTIGELVKTAIDLLTNFIKEVDWEALGAGLMDLILNIDWFGILKSIIDFIGNTLLAFGKLLWGFIKTLITRAFGFGAGSGEISVSGGGSRAAPNGGSRSMPMPQIPRLASGAVIPPNREFMAVLGDQTRGTNIETPLETMVQAFRMAMGESGERDINIRFTGTMAQLVRALKPEIDRETRRKGISLVTGGV